MVMDRSPLIGWPSVERDVLVVAVKPYGSASILRSTKICHDGAQF